MTAMIPETKTSRAQAQLVGSRTRPPLDRRAGRRYEAGQLARITRVIVALSLILSAREASAEPPRNEPTGPRLVWSYPRFRPSQYLTTALVSGAALYLERGTRGLPDNGFHYGILFDDFTRDLLVASTREGRERAASVSDVLWHTTQYFPVADSLITPLVTDAGNIDAAIQMTLLNWQVQTVTFLLTRATHRTVGRRRPIMVGCEKDSTYDPVCAVDTRHVNGSFLSGHASMAFAGAGSTCSHHIALPMYGGGPADAGICALSLASATTVGILRVVADKHWWSDVIAGAALGTATGFGIPFLLHYGYGSIDATSFRAFGSHVALLPLAGEGVVGVSAITIQ